MRQKFTIWLQFPSIYVRDESVFDFAAVPVPCGSMFESADSIYVGGTVHQKETQGDRENVGYERGAT